MRAEASGADNNQPPGADQANILDVYARRVTGASTLDLIKRLAYPNERLTQVSDPVRNEMFLQAHAGLDLQQSRKTCKPVANMNTLGERLGRPKEHFVPGTPVTRKLRYSHLARMDGKDVLSMSRSAPTLPPHPRRILHDQLRLEARLTAENSSTKDALDLALQLQAPSSHSSKPPAQVFDDEDTRLQQHRQHLEKELLHVTKKLNRKYTKALFPPRTPSPSKIHNLAAKWSQDQQSQALTEDERYSMYMEGRYATQTQVDFYARDAEVRDSTNNKHRHNAIHTKYGNALVMNKNSLRGKF